jgi:hypothetical protein
MNSVLRELIRQAVDFTKDHRNWGLREREALQLLDAVGERNEHLANPLNKSREVPYFRPRQTPLTGEEPVYGKYLTMDYCGHEPSLSLKTFDTKEELERDILSEAGIINAWTTYVFAFIDGKLRDYEVVVTYTDGSTDSCDNNKEQDGEADLMFPNVAKMELRWRKC